jgi:hypothetical protein
MIIKQMMIAVPCVVLVVESFLGHLSLSSYGTGQCIWGFAQKLWIYFHQHCHHLSTD